jgi:hypothetical protein
LTCKRKSCPNLCSGHGICAKKSNMSLSTRLYWRKL